MAHFVPPFLFVNLTHTVVAAILPATPNMAIAPAFTPSLWIFDRIESFEPMLTPNMNKSMNIVMGVVRERVFRKPEFWRSTKPTPAETISSIRILNISYITRLGLNYLSPNSYKIKIIKRVGSDLS